MLARLEAGEDRGIVDDLADSCRAEGRHGRAHRNTTLQHCAGLILVTGVFLAAMPRLRHFTMVHRHPRHDHARLHRKRREEYGERCQDQMESAKHQGVVLGSGMTRVNFLVSQCAPSSAGLASIHTAIATIITFSVRETKPSGTRLSPPTQAHFSSRLSM